MKKTVCIVICLLLAAAALTASAESTPLLYRVTDSEGHAVYLLGTYHIGYADMFPIAGIDAVLDECEAVALEVCGEQELAEARRVWLKGEEAPAEEEEDFLSGMGGLAEFLGAMSFGGNGLTNEELAMIAGLLDMEGAEFFLRSMQPSMLYNITMMALCEQAGLSMDYSVEYYVIALAEERGLPLMELEGDSMQNELLDSLSEEANLSMLRELLADPEGFLRETFAEVEAWRTGDREGLAGDTGIEGSGDPGATDEILAELEAFDEKLTQERNLAFAEQVKGFLSEGTTVLVAIGAAHVSDPGGLVDLLSEAGYTVE